jgi:Xaa-Pro aminopeptidase
VKSASSTVRGTSPAERERRRTSLLAAAANAGYEALIIGARGDEFMRGRIQYASDIFLWAGWAYLVLARGTAVFIADPLGGHRGADAGWVDEVRETQTPGAEIATILADAGVRSGVVGIAGLADIVAAAHLTELEATLPGSVTVADATDVFDRVREIKSDEEIANLEETSTILRAVYDALTAEIRPGVEERDLLAEAHRLCRQLGCVDGIAMSGRPPAATFGPGPGGVIAKSDVVVMDLEWGGPSGYWLELRRCFSLGPPADDVRRYWESRVETFEACLASIKPGASSDEILAARDRADARHGRSAGDDVRYSAHGIGIDSLEPPWVPGKERELREGMALSLHPNVRLTPEESRRFGGISVGDNVLVTASGARRMTYEREEWVVLEP